MRCSVCGHDDVIETEYRTGDTTAPALECGRCHAVHLDERVATSQPDRDAIQRARAARQAAGTALDSGTHRSPPASLSVGQVDSALSEIDLLLARARVALDFLLEMTEVESGEKAIADLQWTVERIGTVVDDLGKRCARETAKQGRMIVRPPKTGLAS